MNNLDFINEKIKKLETDILKLNREKKYYEQLTNIDNTNGWDVEFYKNDIDNIYLEIKNIEYDLKLLKQIKIKLDLLENIRQEIEELSIAKYDDNTIEAVLDILDKYNIGGI